jgi:hypothetical protein
VLGPVHTASFFTLTIKRMFAKQLFGTERRVMPEAQPSPKPNAARTAELAEIYRRRRAMRRKGGVVRPMWGLVRDRWDPDRQVWAATDGFAYESPVLTEGGR